MFIVQKFSNAFPLLFLSTLWYIRLAERKFISCGEHSLLVRFLSLMLLALRNFSYLAVAVRIFAFSLSSYGVQKSNSLLLCLFLGSSDLIALLPIIAVILLTMPSRSASLCITSQFTFRLHSSLSMLFLIYFYLCWSILVLLVLLIVGLVGQP